MFQGKCQQLARCFSDEKARSTAPLLEHGDIQLIYLKEDWSVLRFHGEPKDVAKVRKLLVPTNTTPDESKEVQQPNKKRKIEPDVISVEYVVIKDNPPKCWLSLGDITLTEADQGLITSGEMLNDKHISFAQEILKRQFNKLLGLQSTLLLSRLRAPLLATGALQIIHSRQNHWIVASTIGCCAGEVMVFDSLYSSLDQATMKVILQVFGADVKVKLEKSPQQLGVRDCGVFAVAVCTSLANEIHPSNIAFDQNAMRHHLLNSFV